ncbi:hypothetical protein C1645_877992 [Glomus cerebriforme]|uniref:Actin-like ATPase domain-containing protein n=1 Tax=Glomus cerebriforme TaxID=658196 RepID=A0A397SMX9_9GLOM|nr:hypothetical protein C1645_877992 [Glomus cerebriforme]
MSRRLKNFFEDTRNNTIRSLKNENLKIPEDNKPSSKEKKENNIRVVVGLDFGTTFSGFAYCHVNENKNICSNESWHGEVGDLPDKFKRKLPIDYKKAITDYLKEIGKVIKETVATRWPKIDYFGNVLLVITVPAEFSEKSKAIMRTCAFDAELINEKCSTNLQFITEPEAAAVYCMDNLKGQNLTQPGNLTTRKLLNDEQLGEITERAGDFCGSTFIDAGFIDYLRRKLGDEPIDLLRDNNYGQMQYLIQQFCKFEDDEWVIEIDFESMKSIFEPVIQTILCLIKAQLDNIKETCSAMFLVGGFSESKYLQKRIHEEFSHRVETISVPTQPMAAIARGAAIYGLSIKSDDLNNLDDNMKCVISSRVLKYTYGIKYAPEWKNGDPTNRKILNGRILKFDCLAKRGTKVNINQEVTRTYKPTDHNQTRGIISIYYTQEYEGEYCDDPGMNHLGNLLVDLPGAGLDRSITFGMVFGKMEIIATSRDEQTGKSYKATFKFNLDD